MTDYTSHTLGVLIRTMRYSYTERRLCCAACGGEVKLTDGVLVCQVCPAKFSELRQLGERR